MSGEHYLPLTEADRKEMLSAIGIETVEELFADIPQEVRVKGRLNLPEPLSEAEALKHLKALAGENINLQDTASFLGAGIYDHLVPAIVKHITGRSEFYTSYTPYQPEISQGLLQVIFEYQTMLCQLTGLDVSNASMYDGATAVTEAAIMGCGATRRSKVVISEAVSPFYRSVLKTYFKSRGLSLVEIGLIDGRTDMAALQAALDDQTAAVVLQQPNFFGVIEDLHGLSEVIHAQKALFVLAADPLSLPILKTPAEYGADIAAGEAQGLGVAPSFGGPLLGYIAAGSKYARQMPGRIAGQTIDTEGNRGFVLTLQTREQHIRREKAASNICSNEALAALAAAVYMAAMGPTGLKEVALQSLQKADYARERISSLSGYSIPFEGPYFKEFVIKVPVSPAKINGSLLKDNLLGGLDLRACYPGLGNMMLFSVTEKRTREEIDRLVAGLERWR